MAKWVCNVCGYVYEGDAAPEACPVCKAPASKFTKQDENLTWAAEHVVGVAQGVSEDIVADLRANFQGECSEVGMYLAMARVAHREGYPEVGLYYEKAAYEEAEHAAKFAELLGEVVTDSTKKNLQMRVEAENGATAGKFDLAKRAKAADLDAIHDTVPEMAKDEARHGKAFAGLLKRYFGEKNFKFYMKQLIPRAYAPGIFFNQIFLYSPQSFSYCHSALHHGDMSDTPKTALYHFHRSSADHIPAESMY